MSTEDEIAQFLARAAWLHTIDSPSERYEAWERTGGPTYVRFAILPLRKRPASSLGERLYRWFARRGVATGEEPGT